MRKGREWVFSISEKSIGLSTFANCFNLRSLSLNDGLKTIDRFAFQNSGVRGIEIPSSVESVPAGCFNGSDITYINFSDGVKLIEDEAASSCNNLLVVNFPSTLTKIGYKAVSSKNVVAVNSPAIEPASTGAKPFEDIDKLSCSLSIPRQSFTQYLTAEYWGAFVGIRNCLDVTVPDDVDLTYMDESDYQDMIDNENGSNVSNARKRSLQIMRENGVVSETKGYGKLFNGASLYKDGEKEIRLFFNTKTPIEDFTVSLDGVDITAMIENGMYVLPASNSSGSLVITSTNASVKNIENFENVKRIGNVYNVSGALIKADAKEEDLQKLPKGLYIYNGKKVIIR